MDKNTTVTIKANEMASYATALRSHLSAAIAYMRINDYKLVEAELDGLEMCASMIRARVNQRAIANQRLYD